MSKNKMEILTELPTKNGVGANKGRVVIDWKQTVGMTIEVEHEDYGIVDLKVVNHYGKKSGSYIVLDYNGYVLEGGIRVGGFMDGNIGSILNITNSSRNTFYLDENNVLHIYGENKNGKWEALYSGDYIKEVMNSTWYVSHNRISTSNYNFESKKRTTFLHHVDIKPKSNMVIDHIGNIYSLIDKFYDNRIENLREVSHSDNSRNKKCKNEWGYTGLRVKRNNKSWVSEFTYNNKIKVHTKTKHNLNEAILDNLIAQRYLGYKHQEEEFYKLDELSEDRIKEVTDLLDIKMKKVDNKIHEIKEYKYDIETKDNYYILKKNGLEMLFNCDLDYIKDKLIYSKNSNGVYWTVRYLKDDKNIHSKFHRDILGLKPNEYKEYKIQVDHLNNNTSDNRFNNLTITTNYSNQCNKIGMGYSKTKSGSYLVQYMADYKFWNLIGGVRKPTFKTEQEAIGEVNRRKTTIDNSRVKLKSKEELDKLIKYCLDFNYLQENGLADLDLGYLYWKGILEVNKAA